MKYQATLVFPDNIRFEKEDEDLDALLVEVRKALDHSGVKAVVEVRRIEVGINEEGDGEETRQSTIAQISWRIHVEPSHQIIEGERSLFNKHIYR